MKKLRNLFILLLLAIVCTALPSLAEQEQKHRTVTTEELKKMIDSGKENPLIIDARNPEEYEEVHIKGAINIPVSKLEKDPALLQGNLDRTLIFYCNGVKCGKSKKSASIATGFGYRNVLVYAEGMPVWEEKGMPIFAGPSYEKKIATKKLTAAELNEIISKKPDTFTLVDVRDKSEFAEGHIPGAINIPAATFAGGSAVLDKGKKIIVYCNAGGRSYNAYRKLMKLAYPDINQALLADWKAAGLKVVK